MTNSKKQISCSKKHIKIRWNTQQENKFLLLALAGLVWLCIALSVTFGYALEEAGVERAKKLAEELGQEMKITGRAKDDVAEEHYQKGIALYKDKEYGQALEEFRLVLELVPGYKKAGSYLERCQAQEQAAKEGLSRDLAGQRQKKLIKTLSEGRKYYHSGDLEQAEGKFDEALKLDAENQIALAYQKRINKELKDNRELRARIEARRREREREKETDEYLSQGLEYYKRGLYQEAITEWEKILPLTPPADFTRRKAEVLIVDAREHMLESKDEDVGLKKEVERQSALLDADRNWVLPQYLQARTEEVIKAPKEKEPAAKRKLAEQARQIVKTLDFDDAHLREVLTYLSKVSGVNIVLDETIFPEGEEEMAGLEKKTAIEPKVKRMGVIDEEFKIEGLGGEEKKVAEVPSAAVSPRVTIHLRDIPLIDALDIILRTKGLKYRLEENVIWITTPEQLEGKAMVTKIYRLSTGVGAAAFEEPEKKIETGIEWEE